MPNGSLQEQVLALAKIGFYFVLQISKRLHGISTFWGFTSKQGSENGERATLDHMCMDHNNSVHCSS
jgi:hypothetical protein